MKRIRSMVLAAVVAALAVLATSPVTAAPAPGGRGGFSLAPPVGTGFALQRPTVLTSLRIGTGSTPDVTVGADDLFIEGTLEVDGATRFDGAADFNSTIDMSAGLATLHSFRVGTGSTPDVTLGPDDGFIEGTLEVDGATRLDGTTTAQAVNGTTLAGSTSVTAGAGGNTVVSSPTGTVYAGTARPTAEIFVPAGEFLGNAGSPALALIGSANAQGWALDGTADESISAMFKLPDGYAPGTNMSCYVGWSSTDTNGLDAIFDVITVPTAAGADEDSGAAGNTDSVTSTDSTTADALVEAPVTVAGAELAADDIVYVTVNRDADNASDTLDAVDASVHYLRCTVTVTDVQ